MEEHSLSRTPSQEHNNDASSLTKLKFNNESGEVSHDKKARDSFFRQGELRLLHGDSSGVQFFDLALQLDPSNANLYYDQGLALLEFGSEKGREKNLLLAAKRFKFATSLNPSYFEAWLAWGNTLFLLGKTTQEFHYFLSAEGVYRKAIALQEGQSSDALADLYWNQGRVWSVLGKKSKEPSDMQSSLEAFRKALTYQEDLPIDFWHDYGYGCLDVGLYMNDLTYFIQGIHCFKNAVSINISSFESWSHLATALSKFYQFTHDEDHFIQANECYTTAAQLNSQNSILWFHWAELLYTSGRLIKDPKRTRAAIEKCRKAQDLDEGNPYILGLLSEALAMLGVLKEDIGLIHEAQNTLIELVEEEPTPALLHSYGFVLFCLGQYFNDLDYFYQATEKFQEGLSIDRSCHKLWHALGYSYAHAAQIEEDPTVFEKAHKFYQKAIALQGLSFYYFDYGYSLLKYAEYHNDPQIFETALNHFECALNLQKDSMYIHPDWLFYYGVTLDHLAGFQDDLTLYGKSLEVLQHVLMIDPEYPQIHHHLALVYSHLAELGLDPLPYTQACYHYKLAYKRQEENDQIILDWAITLAAFGDSLENPEESFSYFKDAEFKMTQAAKLGNVHAYYHLACLYSLLNQLDTSMYFMKKAADFEALPPIQELVDDDWLENLRGTSSFEHFLSFLESKASDAS